MSTRKTIGLALGSGAYRGFTHIGVIRSLEKHHIPIDYLSGSSIGAWVAAYYALFKNIGAIEKDLIDNQQENLSVLLDFGGTKGLIGGEKFLAYLNRKLHKADFSEAQIPLSIVATDLTAGRPYVFTEGSLAQAVRASCGVPLVFKPLEHQGKFLSDGGLSNPVPVDAVKSLGADLVIGVNLYNQHELQEPKYAQANILVRGTATLLYNLAQADMRQADIIIEPDASAFLKTNSIAKYFDRITADQLIRLGEEATDRALPDITKLLS
jgi:NTE family protein